MTCMSKNISVASKRLNMFSINLITLDSYQSAPVPELDVTFSEFRGTENRQVPVIRIFGATFSGKKTCLHIHGVFPYIYIPCTVDKNVNSYMYRLAAGIDSAINVSLGSATSNNQHVYKIQQISGIPFYGYHKKEHLFFKIYFYNPAMAKRASDLMQNGAVLNQSLQPHEAHIPFVLQFMIDYNLYGMSDINLTNVKYRQSTHMESRENSQNKNESLLDSQKYLPTYITRQSTCELEVDAQASDILNRQEILDGMELNPGIAAIWKDEEARRDNKGLPHPASQLLYSNTSDGRSYCETENDIYQEKRLLQRLQCISQSNNSTLSSTISSLSYPLEVENEDKWFNASHVVNHFKSSLSQAEYRKKVVLENESMELEKYELEETFSHEKTSESSILDLDDMHLVDMLANLAEEKDEEIIVDDDSMLGSQYSILSNQIKDDNEDDEAEDLNITSLDMDTLSSWNSTTKPSSQSPNSEIRTNNKNIESGERICNTLIDNSNEESLLNFPQYDGVNDLPVTAIMIETKKKKRLLRGRSKIGTASYLSHHSSLLPSRFRNFHMCIDSVHNMLITYRDNNCSLITIDKFDQILNNYYFSKFIVNGKIILHNDLNNCTEDSKVLIKQASEFDQKYRKTIQDKKKYRKLLRIHCNRKMLNTYNFDHNDLDVYDINNAECTLSIDNIDCDDAENRSLTILDHTNDLKFDTYTNLINQLNLPAFDGTADDSSHDSESDRDVTIDREEKRICVYKSGVKSNQGKIIDITPKKRKFDFEDGDIKSPNKRHNVNVDTSEKQYTTPTKTRTCSPRHSARKYCPLNITVISPKTNKSMDKRSSSQNEPSTSKLNISSISTTVKQKNPQLRISLLREKGCALSPKSSRTYTGDKSEHIQRMPFLHELNNGNNVENVDNESTSTEVIQLQKEGINITQTINTNKFISKTKEVRKRLSFLNTDENDINIPKSTLDENCCENLPLAECIIRHSDEKTYSVNNSMSNINNDNGTTSMHADKTETVTDKCNLPSTSKHNVNLYIDDQQTQTIEMNENQYFESHFEDEGEDCNMTYTQYINKKLECDIESLVVPEQSSICDIAQSTLLTIVPKFNAPSRERIINSMKIYGIAECKSSGAFFSDKTDLIKQKESCNKSHNIADLVPFKSSLDRVTGITLWRRVKVNEFHPSGANIKSCNMKRALAGYNSLVIQPLIQPPASKHVRTWVQAKEYLQEKMKKRKEKENDLNMDTVATETKSTISDFDCNKNIEIVEQIVVNEMSENIEQRKENFQHSNESSSNLNASLRKILENPQFYKNNETQQHLGLSYGQIEFSIKSHSGNIADENFQNAKGLTVHQYLTILCVEVHVVTRNELLPDPEKDPIEALFYAIHNDFVTSSEAEQVQHGAILVDPTINSMKLKNIQSTTAACPISYVNSEKDLLHSLVTLIRHCDPDILMGWEIESLSWGYVFQRASIIGFNNYSWQISRIANVKPVSAAQTFDKDNSNDVKVPGRIILDVWRIMRHEVALLNYTFENVMYNVLRERIACPTFKTLTDWWKYMNIAVRWKVITHYTIRVLGTIKVIMHLDIIGRTCEHARLIGIQFYEVFSRGSQFRVESMMLRLAKPLNYIAVSPSMQQRAKMRAPEALPLIMEPQSTFYTDPLIVLDFQSLYPSIIIAYNYCFSTCLGRVEHIGQCDPFEFGATTLRVKKSAALKLRGKVNFSPCGVAFVKPEIRTGILPRMLTEILNTRLMVKDSMKLHGKENRLLQRVLHSQQLGLKLIANVTYGYTAANFSGRMPCIEVGDSVVSKGRETLERAIKIVESTPKWGAQVVYGDTDSLFILLPGKSKDEAFHIGGEIADTVTAANPPPVKLKFEKVLQPSILQTKKRYCGYMYETLDQKEPEYLAKGIETVRRDGCPAVAKILEKSLKILFDTKDLSHVKRYVTRQFDKILRRKISIQDLTFAKEFRGLRGYKASACVPALELTRRLMRKDPRAIPRTGERVPYIIVAGAPNQALIHCIRTPMEVILDEGLSPNSVYYITKAIIPPLNRCLNLIDIDVNTWYREMCHRQTPDKTVSLFTGNQKSTIRQFFSTVVCVACGDQTKKDLCTNCISRPSQTVITLHEKIRWLERTYYELTSICQSCTGYSDDPKCESLDCPVLYRLAQARRDLVQIPYINSIISHGCNPHIEEDNVGY